MKITKEHRNKNNKNDNLAIPKIKSTSKSTSNLKAKLGDESGASLIEFLGTLTFILMLILLITQTALVFYNGVLTSHALNLAAQEVAARGAVDVNSNDILYRHLPGSSDPSALDFPRAQCGENYQLGESCIKAFRMSDGQEITANRGTILLGTESGLNRGAAIKLTYTYKQPLKLLAIFGVDYSVDVTREFIVASQSLNE